MSLIYNATFDKNTRKLSFEDRAGNEIYSCTIPERGPAVDDITKPLTFKATQDRSAVTLTNSGSPTGDFQTSTDGGNTWVDYTPNTAIPLNTGDKVSFRAKADRTSEQNAENYFYFRMEGKIEAWHNVMSLYRTNDFATYESVVEYAFFRLFHDCTSLTEAPELPATTLSNFCYNNMFNGCTSLTKAPELPATTLASSCYYYMFKGCTSLAEAPVLPATTLANFCYNNMFDGCTSLIKAPELPATTLTQRCYQSMFYGCTSLTEAPILPATTLASSCYKDMFNGCTSLIKAPELPATTLAQNCYDGMFWGCTSLTKAPVLPATTLANFCYNNMFKNCTSLTEAPVLPATTLENQCYQYMFMGCTSLTKAPELPATTLTIRCYSNMFNGCRRLNEVRCKISSSYSSSDISSYASIWLRNVSSTGTFYTNADANWPSGESGIPTSWTRVNEGAPTVNDKTKPLTFRATQNGSTVTLKKQGTPVGADFQTSRDGGNTWEDYTIDTAIALNNGDEVSFRAKADRTFAQSAEHYFQFNMTGKIEARHNVMSLYRTNDFATYESVMEYAFYRLFYGCTSLTKDPVLPATTLATDCYRDMFRGCTSLTEAPYLPATSLAQYCYKSMFLGCTSLTEVPVLQATRLGTRCYWQMFEGCSSLNEVYCYIPSSYSTEVMSAHADGWLSNVSPTGTFHTNADANWPSGSASGIPEGWTRVNS